MSETAGIRSEVLQYCQGHGVDIGCGGDKVTPEAIGFDLQQPYTKVGTTPIDVKGDARQLPFADNSMDYAFSSHLLEDFPNTAEVLNEWFRVVKPLGYLVIYCPVEKVYREHCQTTGQPYNLNHTIAYMSLGYLKTVMQEAWSDDTYEIVKEIELINAYSFLIVVRKKG